MSAQRCKRPTKQLHEYRAYPDFSIDGWTGGIGKSGVRQLITTVFVEQPLGSPGSANNFLPQKYDIVLGVEYIGPISAGRSY